MFDYDINKNMPTAERQVKMERKKKDFLEKSFLLSIISTIFFYLCSVSYLSPIVERIFGRVNIPAMALTIIFYFAAFLLLRKKEVHFTKLSLSLIFLFVSAFLLTSYALEKNIYNAKTHLTLEQSLPWYVLLPTVILIIGIYCFFQRVLSSSQACLRISQKFSTRRKKSINVIIGIILVAVSVYNQYNVNFSHYYDYYNIHAYSNSILNLFWGQPFTETIKSIYGHYAFFYYPVIKLLYSCGFHNIYKIIILINCLLTGISLSIWIWVIFRIIKNPQIQLFGIFMVCYFNSSRVMEIYQQVHPHRIFPIAVTILMIALWYCLKNKRTLIIPLGYLVCIFILAWNTECGIFSTISWSAMQICSSLQIKSKKSFFSAFIYLLAIPLTFLAAVLFCGILNKLFGGEMISIQDFIFPLYSAEYMNLIEIPLQNYPSSWMSIMVLFLSFLGYGIKDTILNSPDNRKSDQTAACFSTVVLGLGSLSYAINRPAYCNFYIILPFAALLISITADSFFSDREKLFSRSNEKNTGLLFRGVCGFLSYAVLLTITASSLINIPYKHNVYKYYKNTTQIDEVQKWILSQQNKQAVALGNSPSVFYSWFGWNPGIYYMDTADYSFIENAYAELFEETKHMQNKSAFISRDIKYLLPEEFFTQHSMPSIIEIGDFVIEYWVPNQQIMTTD